MEKLYGLWIMVLFMAFFLIGCSNNDNKQILNPTQTQSLSPTLIRTTTSNPTDVPGPTELPTMIITPTFGPDLSNSTQGSVNQECNHLVEIKQNDQKDEGIIAFETHSPQNKYQISFLNLKTNETSIIQQEPLADLVVTPNRKIFAFRNTKNHTIEIFSNDMKFIRSLKMGQDWGNIAEWIDNKTLVIIQDKSIVSQPNFSEYPRSVIVLDPFLGKTQIILPDYPDIDKADSNFGWYQFGTTVYDPTFSKVVYPGSITANVGESHHGVILYDISQKKKLAEIPTPFWTGHPPIWSPDGSKFIIMGESELLVISADGKISKVSSMNPSFDHKTGKGLEISPLFYDWSPDGKRVAMWHRRYGSGEITLAIVDPLAGQIIDTCIPAGFDPSKIRTFPYPVWSPDGEKLVVAANYRAEDQSYDVVLVDLNENNLYKIASNLFPAGWLIAP